VHIITHRSGSQCDAHLEGHYQACFDMSDGADRTSTPRGLRDREPRARGGRSSRLPQFRKYSRTPGGASVQGQHPRLRPAGRAKALDRFQPLLLNIAVGGGTWTENGVTEQQVIERYGPAIKGGSTALWNAAVVELVRAHFNG
jgi:hypothetical protein